MNNLHGKVAFITGAARGQGRSHAIRLAREGADIIAVDLCAQIETVAYPMASEDDLQQTVEEVEALGRKIVAERADVRDLDALKEAVAAGTAKLGNIDIAIANAGIAPQGSPEPDPAEMFRSVVEVNLIGAWNTVMATVPSIIEKGQGGSIVLVSSTQGLKGSGGDGSGAMTGYTASKHGVVGLMRTFANSLAPSGIRVNSIHPTGVATPMVLNEVMANYIAARPETAEAAKNLLPVDLIDPIDVSNAIAWLVSDEARYVTGVTLPVDGGFNAK